MLMAESWQVGINIHLGAGIKPSSGLHNAKLTGEVRLATLLRSFAAMVTILLSPVERMVIK